MNFNFLLWFLLVNVVISAEKRKQSWMTSDDKKTPINEESLTGYDYKKLITKLKNNWQFPGTYLQKRGYSQDMNMPHVSDDEPGDGNNERFKHETRLEATFPKPKKFFYFPVQHVSKKQSGPSQGEVGGDTSRSSVRSTTIEPSAQYSQVPQVVVTKQAAQSTTSKDVTTTKLPASTTEKPMGFFQKLKTKISNIFKKGNSSSLSDDYPVDTDYFTSFEEPQKFRRSAETLNGYQKSLERESYKEHVSAETQKSRDDRSILETLQALTARSCNADKVLSENSDIFKNLTQAEVDYIKSFLKFFRENKEKFLVNYINETSDPNKICENLLTTTVKSVNKNTEADTLQVNIEINTLNSSNVKQGNCTDLSKFLNKLKFLAHLHHSVYEVGKVKTRPLDLKLIQGMIDSTRSNLRTIAILGVNDYYQNETNCSPLEINEISPAVGENYEDGVNEIISKYSSDTPKQIESQLFKPPYGETLLDYTAENSPSLVNRVHAKRQALLGSLDQFDEKIDKAVSEVVSSLDKTENEDTLVGSESFYEDYEDQFGSIQKRKSMKNRKKKKKKKKKNKKKPKYSKSTKLEGGDRKLSSQSDTMEINDLVGNSVGTGKLDSTIDMEPNSNMIQLPHNLGDDESFSELNDIKYRLNQDQEEAIEKFIRSLNSPPEIFSFDVDKFIKLNSPIHEQILMEPPSTKTYYEFIDPTSLDRDKNSLQNEPNQMKPQKENVQNENVQNIKNNQLKYAKRDILREYIKGVSDHLREVSRKADMPSQNDPSDKTDAQEKDVTEDWSVQNYANDLETLNYNQFADKSDSKNVDDFIENFYLLNDGTSGILKNEDLFPHISDNSDTPSKVNFANDLDHGKQLIKLHACPKHIKPLDMDYMLRQMDSSDIKEMNQMPISTNQDS